jgi:hypothetical protein
MGRPACSSCCKITDPPKRADCIVDDFKFYYTLNNFQELETLDYVDELVKNMRKGPHEELKRVRQFISKKDAAEYRTNINAFSWSKENNFEVVSHPTPPFDFDFLSKDRTSGYFAPRTFKILLGAGPRDSSGSWPQDTQMSITRELKIVESKVMSSGEDYGISDYQFTEKGVFENGGNPGLFGSSSVEKGCPNEKTMQVQYGINVGHAFGDAAMDAARNGTIFRSGYPRDRTNIQIERTTYAIGYEQTVDGPSIDDLASGPKTFFYGFPIYIQFKAYNFGKQLFVRGRSCGIQSGQLCTAQGGTIDIGTAKVLEGYGQQVGGSPKQIVEDFLEDYRFVDYCLTYPFLKMDDGTYWFESGNSEDRYPSGSPVSYPYGQAEPQYMGTGGPTGDSPTWGQIDLQGTHHWTPKATKSIRVENEDFVWFNPFAFETKFDRTLNVDFADTNDGIGVDIQPVQWQERFPDSKDLTPVAEPVEVPEPAPGEDREAYEDYLEQKKRYEQYREEMIKLLLYYNGDPAQSPIKGVFPIEGKEQTEYVPGPYFEFVDNKLKGNEYDIPQKQYLHIKRTDLLYNVYDMILTGEKAFKFLSNEDAFVNDYNIANDAMWTKWHENIIVVQVRSEESAEDWLERSGVEGAKVRVGDEVYYPVGECNKGTITKINYDATEPTKILNVEIDDDDQNPHLLGEIELKKDTITYGIDGRVYRMIMWLESKLVGNEFEADWEEVIEDGKVTEIKYKPLSYKVKDIYIENYNRPYPVGPEISSFDKYPNNDTKVNLVTKISFKEIAEPRKVEDVEPHVLSMHNIADGECEYPIKPTQWLADFATFDNNDSSVDPALAPFYYLDEDDEPVARLLSDDDVITIGTKQKTSYIKNQLKCDDIAGGKHWDLNTWIYYQPEHLYSRHFEPELTKDLPDCRTNPYAATYNHIFPKSGAQERIPYINKDDLNDGTWDKTVDFSFTQTPDAGYLFTTEDGDYYKITFEFEPILDWRKRILKQLREGN